MKRTCKALKINIGFSKRNGGSNTMMKSQNKHKKRRTRFLTLIAETSIEASVGWFSVTKSKTRRKHMRDSSF